MSETLNILGVEDCSWKSDFFQEWPEEKSDFLVD
jgi:hypothetical protein